MPKCKNPSKFTNKSDHLFLNHNIKSQYNNKKSQEAATKTIHIHNIPASKSNDPSNFTKGYNKLGKNSNKNILTTIYTTYIKPKNQEPNRPDPSDITKHRDTCDTLDDSASNGSMVVNLLRLKADGESINIEQRK